MSSISHTLPDLLSRMTPKHMGLEDLRKTELSTLGLNMQNSDDKSVENPTTTTSSKVELNIEKNADLSFLTAEGDKVTLSSRSKLTAAYSIYTNQGTLDEGSAAQKELDSFDFNQESGFEISIDGHLSKKESKDIRKAIKIIGKMARDFVSGKIKKTMKRASKLMRLDSISSFEAALQYKQSVSVQHSYTEAVAPAVSDPIENTQLPQKPVTPPEAPVSEPVEVASSAPQAQAPAPKEVASPSPPASPAKDLAPQSPQISTPTVDTPTTSVSTDPSRSEPVIQLDVERLVKKMTNVVVESNVETRKLAKYTSQFLDHLSAKYSYKNGDNSLEFKLVRQIQSSFTMRFEETDKGEKTDSPSEIEAAETEPPETIPEAITA